MTSLRERLESHPIKNLKAEIRKVRKDIKVSGKKKSELVEIMVKFKKDFDYIKKFEKSAPAPKKGKAPEHLKKFQFKKTGRTAEDIAKGKAPAKAKPSPAKVKEVVKKAPASELKKATGLSKEEALKLKPSELFGKLPKELRQKVLDPKETGVVVGREKVSVQEFMKEFKDFRRLKNRSEDTHERDPNLSEADEQRIRDLFIEMNRFLSNYEGVLLTALGIKTSKKNLRELVVRAQRTKKWQRKLDIYDGKSARDIWRENTGDFVFRIKKLMKELGYERFD